MTNWINYCYVKKRYVSYIDILGFKSAIDHSHSNGLNSGETIFTLWNNCLRILINKMEPEWSNYKDSPENILVNFVQVSDSTVIYSSNPDKILSLTSFLFEAAFIWGVPIRCGLGYGDLTHIEDPCRPGTRITLIGSGLTDAYDTERSVTGTGMRSLVSSEFIKNFSSISNNEFYEYHDNIKEFKWWERCELDLNYFQDRQKEWWNKKNVGKWFVGENRKDTELIFSEILKFLSKKLNNSS